MKLLTARPCFLFTVLLSTEDSSAVKIEKGNQNYAKLAFRSKNKINKNVILFLANFSSILQIIGLSYFEMMSYIHEYHDDRPTTL